MENKKIKKNGKTELEDIPSILRHKRNKIKIRQAMPWGATLLAMTIPLLFGNVQPIGAVKDNNIGQLTGELVIVEDVFYQNDLEFDGLAKAIHIEDSLEIELKEDVVLDDLIEIEIIATSNMDLLEKQFYYVKEIPLEKNLQKFIYEKSKASDLKYIDVLSLIATESDFRPNTININTNGTKDHGLFQMNDCNIPTFRKELNISGSVLDVYNNSTMGIYELSNMSKLWESSKGNYDQHLVDILSSYNKGYNGYKKNGPATKYMNRFNAKKEGLINTINSSNI